MSLTKPQSGVAIGAAGALVVTLVALGLAAMAHPFDARPDALALRLHLLAMCGLAPALTLAVAIGRLANHRFKTPQDIDGSGLTAGSERAKLLQALLQNTLEQLALALPVYAFWLLAVPPGLLAMAPTAAALFLVGRLCFFWGYARGAPGRAFGFGLTFYPTALLLLAALIHAPALAP